MTICVLGPILTVTRGGEDAWKVASLCLRGDAFTCNCHLTDIARMLHQIAVLLQYVELH